jgi:serine/threonine-protein kinase RsbW
MAVLPPPFARRFGDLGTVVDEVHALFAAWAEDGTFDAVLDDTGLEVAKVAVHEWLANLVQHAAFGGRRPEIVLAVAAEDGAEGGGLRCVIEDNSDGFDFEHQLGEQEARVAGPVPSERGRGLLMMIGCAKDLRYEPTAEGRQRLAFLIRPPFEPEDLLPLFPASDAADSFGDARGDGVGCPVEPAP